MRMIVVSKKDAKEYIILRLLSVIISFGLIYLLCLLISGCSLIGNYTKEDKDNFDREKKRFEQHEPYIPSPRDFKKETE